MNPSNKSLLPQGGAPTPRRKDSLPPMSRGKGREPPHISRGQAHCWLRRSTVREQNLERPQDRLCAVASEKAGSPPPGPTATVMGVRDAKSWDTVGQGENRGVPQRGCAATPNSWPWESLLGPCMVLFWSLFLKQCDKWFHQWLCTYIHVYVIYTILISDSNPNYNYSYILYNIHILHNLILYKYVIYII